MTSLHQKYYFVDFATDVKYLMQGIQCSKSEIIKQFLTW